MAGTGTADLVVRVAANIAALQQGMADASKSISAMVAGMSEAGYAASASGKLIAGMSAAGQQAAADLAKTGGAWFQDFGHSVTEGIDHPLEFAKARALAFVEELGPMGIGLTVAAGVATAAGVAIFELAEQAASAGALLNDLSETTGMEVVALSKLTNAAPIAGTTVQALSNAVFMMQKNMGESPDKFEKGLERIGLHFAEFRHLAPEEQLLTIAQHLKATEDPVERNAAGFETMGRQFRDLAPSLYKLNAAMEMTADITPFTKEEAADAEHFEMMIASLEVHMKAFGMAIARDVLPFVSAFVSYGKEIVSFGASWIGTLSGITGTWRNLGAAISWTTAAIDLLRGAEAKLPEVSGPAKHGIEELARSTKAFTESGNAAVLTHREAATIVSELEKEHSKLLATQKKAAEEAHKYAEAWQHLNDLSTVSADVTGSVDAGTRGLILDYHKLGASVEDMVHARIAEKGVIEAVIKVYEDSGKALDATIKRMEEFEQVGVAGANAVAKGLSGMPNVLREMAQHTGTLMLSSKSVASMGTLIGTTFHDAGVQVAAAMTASARSLLPLTAEQKTAIDQMHRLGFTTDEIAQTMNVSLEKVEKETFHLGEAIRHNLHDVLLTIPQTIAGALTGGGGLLGGLEAVGSQLGSMLGKNIGKSISSAVSGLGSLAGPIGSAIGSLAGPLIGLIAGIGGPSKSELSARDTFATFQKQFGSLDKTIAAVGKAYAAMGLSGTRAERDLKAALDATHHSAADVEAALRTINAVLDEQKDHAAAVDGAMAGLLTTIDTVGIGLPTAFRPMIDDLLAMPGLTDAAKGALQGLLDNASPNFAQLESMARSYGGAIDQLGPAFQQAHVTADASKWISDFENLRAAGADMNGVLGFMADEASAVVQESLKFGAEIPENMKPMIQSLIDSGQLLDENKNHITDISGLKFGEKVKTDVDKLKDAIDKLTEAIAKIPGSIPNPFGSWGVPSIPGQDTHGGAIYPQASGGDYLVTRPTLFLAGEGGRSERATFTPSGGGASGSGGRTQPLIIKTYLDARQIAEALTEVRV